MYPLVGDVDGRGGDAVQYVGKYSLYRGNLSTCAHFYCEPKTSLNNEKLPQAFGDWRKIKSTFKKGRDEVVGHAGKTGIREC